MENKVILITGGSGSIGSELVRQLAHKNRIIIFDIDETRMFDLVEELKQDGCDIQGYVIDVRNKDLARSADPNFKPDVIFHCAARKHVSPMEDTPMEAVSVNIEGTYNMLNFAQDSEVPVFINISTDKAVTSDCIMGSTKKTSELMVKNAGYTSVRFGNVMGSRGSVLPIWQKQMDQGKPLTVTDEKMTRYLMTIEEACSLVIEASQMEDVGGKTVILEMGEPHNILNLAKEILNKAGKEETIRMIGVRPGERLNEVLMSPEEEARMERRGKFIIV